MKRVRIVLSFLLVLALLMSFSACTNVPKDEKEPTNPQEETVADGASSEDAEEVKPIKLRFMSGLWDGTRKAIHEYIQIAAKEQFPNVEVEWELTGTSADWLNKLKTYNATGDMPDVFFMASSVTYPIINAGNVLDLLPYAEEDGFLDTYYPDRKSAGVTKEGKLYAFDEGIDYYFRPVIYQNKRVFEEAGITEMPKTWDDFLAVCEVFKQKGIIPISMADKNCNPFTYFFYQMMLTLDDPQMVDDILDGKTDFSDPKAIAAFERVRELVVKGYFPEDITNLDYGGAMELFNSDKAAMYVQMSWDIGGFADNDNVGMVPWPQINPDVDPSDITLIWTPPNPGYAVYSKTENIDVAVKFAEMCAVQAATAASTEFAQPSVLITGVDVTPNLSELAKANLDIHNGASIKQLTFGNYWFSSKMFAEFSTRGSQLLTGQYSGEEFAKAIAEAWSTNFEDKKQ